MPTLAKALDQTPWLRPRLLWAAVAVVSLGLAAALVAVAGQAWMGPRPDFANRTGRPQRPAETGLLLAGSGSNIDLLQLVAADCAATHPGFAVWLDAGMGSTGGLRALRDGVVDAAMVSRPLRADEVDGRAVRVDYARSPVAFAAHPGVLHPGVTTPQIVALYRGETTTWPDGIRAVVVQRERGDSSHLAVDRVLAGFAAANQQAWQSGRWRVVYSDRAMSEALLATPGAVGLVDVSATVAANQPLRLLRLDGVAPDPSAVQAGTYSLYKDHALVLPSGLQGAAQVLMACLGSAAGRGRIASVRAMPLLGPWP